MLPASPEQTRGNSKPSRPFTADTKVSQRNNCFGLSRRGTAEIERGGKRKEKGAREREEAAFVGRDAFITVTAAAAGSRLGHSLSAGVSQTEAGTIRPLPAVETLYDPKSWRRGGLGGH